ncbi:hypothetical protein G5C51_01160 [Streptomyces sp. A7024]|uniref:Uncharacterized protein n=1 Tax=Streptomyces coryli TaxID=1128680 RepID=A0A6G4TRV7_9ACTN|nr:hypothetical protein [Streptomyces coryli]NGN62522.1 hypothetical protein [Streptomyces coryli]
MSAWNFKDDSSPHDEALARIAQDAGNGSEDLLGTQPAGMTDTMRTRICTDRRDDYLNNDAAIKQLPFKKLEAFEKASAGEKERRA